MSETKKFSLIKPTQQTPFHIDFAWWRENDRNWHVHLRGLLCAEHQETFNEFAEDQLIDWIDPQTAEIKQIDGFQHILIMHCAQQENFLNEHTVLVEAIFRLLLANGNIPMPAQELASRLGRPADMILRTISGVSVYKGIRPYNV